MGDVLKAKQGNNYIVMTNSGSGYVERLNVQNAGGFILKNSSDVQVGSIASGGAWSLGASATQTIGQKSRLHLTATSSTECYLNLGNNAGGDGFSILYNPSTGAMAMATNGVDPASTPQLQLSLGGAITLANPSHSGTNTAFGLFTVSKASGNNFITINSDTASTVYIKLRSNSTDRWELGHDASTGATGTANSYYWYSFSIAGYVGGITPAGSWTLGAVSTSSITTTLQAGNTSVLDIVADPTNSNASTTSVIRFLTDGTYQAGVGCAGGGDGDLYIQTRVAAPIRFWTNTLERGSVSATGAWTLGPSGSSNTNLTVEGKAYIDGNSIGSITSPSLLIQGTGGDHYPLSFKVSSVGYFGYLALGSPATDILQWLHTPDNGSTVNNLGSVDAGGSWIHRGYTQLGANVLGTGGVAPYFAVKKITTTTPNGATTQRNVAHGLSAARIKFVTGSYYHAGFADYRNLSSTDPDGTANPLDRVGILSWDATNITLQTRNASASEYNQSCTLYIFYENA